MSAAAPAAVSTAHVNVETASSLDASTSSSLLSPPRPRLPSSRSAPSVSAAAASASPFTSDESRAPSPAVASLVATPHTPRSRRVSATGATPIRTPSRKGKERAAEVEADAIGEVSVQGSARRGLRELVARDERRRERERERDRERGLPVARTKDMTDVSPAPETADARPRRYYVLTNAGKPVFSIGHADEDTLTNLMGVVQALVSIFAEDDDKLRSVVRGRTRIAFLIKPEMYLFAVSDWGEPEHVLRMQLEYINLQILSVVSAAQLARAFARRSNFDLSRLLVGSEKFLHSLVETCQDDLSFMTTTLQPLRMPPALRESAGNTLTPPAKFKDLLYVLLIAGGRIVTLLRPRRHAVHPADMHLLFNTIATSPTLREVETWLPICLPKFNPQGFVHAYISFIREEVGLIFISADRDAFEPLCGWRELVVEQLSRDGALDRIAACVKNHPYTVAEIGSPGLRHFVYKNRGMVQITSPEWEEPYTKGSEARRRLVTLYQKAQDALFARPGTGQPTPLRLLYLAGPHEAVLAWLTRPFELYVAVSPHLPMNAVVATANRVAKWVNLEESRLFLRDAPVF
ncbi:DUF254-domain-containing protein [Cutaneotrichosporon oleaginosum]|uniref:Vacuolar fusion protein MON1 n=1 Tax=Cutaneotrichosporon oleaginosum TaxID=879819 RepID=A0A0J0XW00_9TREE|nr:DUF254-domain-containing protein [Cutaneotrichosporon oleaginosum]KLT45241.1 DUF254-domain-containing protein [Cutaneotrichosporon oleaginosum]TXT14928.1 hypothetical protein COLE_01121 [Cutaneotrichosporon oleaginosum]